MATNLGSSNFYHSINEIFSIDQSVKIHTSCSS